MFKRTTQQRNVKGVKPTSRKLPIYKGDAYEFKEGVESVVDLSKGKLTIKNDIITSRRQFTLGKLTLLRSSETDTTESSLQLTSDKVTISQIVTKVGSGSDSESISKLNIYVKPNNTNSSDKDYGTKNKPVEIKLPNTFNSKNPSEANNTEVEWYLWSNADSLDNTMNPAAEVADSGKAFATYVNVISDTDITNDGVTFIGKKTVEGTTTTWEEETSGTTTLKTSEALGYIKNQILTVYRKDTIDEDEIEIYVSKEEFGTNGFKYTVLAKKGGDTYTGPIYYPFRDTVVDTNVTPIAPTGNDTVIYSNPVIFGFINVTEKSDAMSAHGSDTFDGIKFNVKETMTVPPSTESSGKITQYSIEYQENVLYGVYGEKEGELPKTTGDTPVTADSVRYNDSVARVTTTEVGVYSEKASNKWIINKECKFTGNLEYSLSDGNIDTTDANGTYHFGEKEIEITSEGSLVCAPINGLADAQGDNYKLNLIGVTTIDIADGGSIECSSLLI